MLMTRHPFVFLIATHRFHLSFVTHRPTPTIFREHAHEVFTWGMHSIGDDHIYYIWYMEKSDRQRKVSEY